MTKKELERADKKFSEEIEGASYTAEPLDIKYYVRALEMQRQKIEFQGKELARMTKVYTRNARATTIREAIGFLIKVILK